MKAITAGVLAAVALAMATLPKLASAENTVAIVNAGFEDFVLADSQFSRQIGFGAIQSDIPIPGWTLGPTFSDAGTQNMTIQDYPSEAPEGHNVAFVSHHSNVIAWGLPAGNYIEQVLSETVQANSYYTLSAMVGNRLTFGHPSMGGYFMSLRTEAGDVLALDMNSKSIANGTFEKITLGVLVDETSTTVGQRIVLRLGILNLTESNGQVNFDDLQLIRTAMPVPEPSQHLLFALGLAVAVAAHRRPYSRSKGRDSMARPNG